MVKTKYDWSGLSDKRVYRGSVDNGAAKEVNGKKK